MWRFELETPLPCSVEAAWEVMRQLTMLEHVTHLLLKIMPLGLEPLPERTQEGIYQIKLYFFGLLPLGQHTIRVVRVDLSHYEVYTEESSALIKTWNHHLTVYTNAEGQTVYRDALELEARHFSAVLTPVLGALARLFYRYRQARWRALAPTLASTPVPAEAGQA